MASHEEVQKIIDLESRIAFQEDMIHQLSDQLAGQQNTIELLLVQVKHLSDQIKISAFDGQANTHNEMPPHY